MSDTIESISTISGPAAWYGRDLQDNDQWIETLSVIEIAELLSAVAHLDQAGTAMLGMTAADFPLPTLGPRLLTLAAELDTGRGFWLLRGLAHRPADRAPSGLRLLGPGSAYGCPCFAKR